MIRTATTIAKTAASNKRGYSLLAHHLGKALSSSSSSSKTFATPHSLNHNSSCRYFTPMTQDEQDKEKARVLHLSPEEKEEELRKLNREIAKLEMLRGINTGELYTWTGQYKALLRNYGMPLFVYYWTVWTTTGVVIYTAIGVGGLDAMAVIGELDQMTGYDLSSKVDPNLGKIGLALVLNEVLEPLRLPFVVATLKPVLERVNPTKY